GGEGSSHMDFLTSVTARLHNAWFRARDEESGQTLVEYGLIIAIIALGAVLALGFLSGKITTLFSKTGNQLNNVPNIEPADDPPCAPARRGSSGRVRHPLAAPARKTRPGEGGVRLTVWSGGTLEGRHPPALDVFLPDRRDDATAVLTSLALRPV